MKWNPLEHLDKVVISNALTESPWAVPQPASTTLPTGHSVPAATFGQPETVTFWLNVGGSYQSITREEAFVQELWLHFTYGAPAPVNGLQDAGLAAAGLAVEFKITQGAMRAAVLSLPHVLETITQGGYSEADVWAYTLQEVQWAVELVAVGSSV